jgi:hypothetical protein
VKIITLLLFQFLALGCDLDLLGTPESQPEITIGDLTLSRSDRDNQRYRIRMQVLNEHSDELVALTVRGNLSVPLKQDTSLEAPISVTQETAIRAGTRRTVEFIFESPFSVVPPEMATLRNIAVGSANFQKDEHLLHRPEYWVQWPWELQESNQ